MNFRDLVEIFPMMVDRGEILANVSERMEERSYIDLANDREVTKKKFAIRSTVTRQNFDDVFLNPNRKRNRGIAISERHSVLLQINLYVWSFLILLLYLINRTSLTFLNLCDQL